MIGIYRNHYDAAFRNRSNQAVGEELLKYFSDLFSLEIPLGKMFKMMPGMVKFALRGSANRRDLIRFFPQMIPVMKKALGLK